MEEKVVKQDVEEMLNSFLETPEETPPTETPPAETPPTETPPVETPPEEKPPEEKPPEEKPPVEAPPEEKPSEEKPPVETPPEEKPPEETPPETPPTELELLRQQNKLLLERIEKISGGEPVTAAPVPPATEPKPGEPTPAEPKPAVTPSTEIKVDEINFLEGRTQEDIERIIEDPAELNRVLNQVYLKAVEQAIPLAQERSLLAIPQVVVAQLQRYNTMKGLVDDFYKENEDLRVVQRTVGMIANEVHSEHTDWTAKQVFDEAAKRTRKALGLPEPPPKPASDPSRPVVTPQGAPPDPAFANPTGSRRRGPARAKLTGMAKEIDDLMPRD